MPRHIHTLVLASLLGACLPVQGPEEQFIPRSDRCGDRNIDEGEVCDRDELAGVTCEDLGFGAGTLGCAEDCNDYDRAGCAAPPSCNDGVRQPPEVCDGQDLAGLTCQSLGYASGELHCLANCGEIDHSGCVPVQGQDAGVPDSSTTDQGATPSDGSSTDQLGPGDSAVGDQAMPDSAGQDNAPFDGGPQPDSAVVDAGTPDAAAAVVKWTYGTKAMGHPAIAPDGRIIALRGEWVTPVDSLSSPGADEVVALHPDGTLAWSFAETDIRFAGAPAVTADGTIYVVGSPGRLFALNPDGSKRWVFEATRGSGYSLAYGYLSQPAFGPDGTIYLGAPQALSYTGAPPASFYAVNPDGSERWAMDIDNISSSPVVNAAGAPHAVFAGEIRVTGNIPDALRRLDPASGATTWDFTAFWPIDDPARERHSVGLDLALVPGGSFSMSAYRFPDLMASDGDTVLLRVAAGATAVSWITDALTDDVLAGPVFSTDGRGFMPMCTASYTGDEVRVVSSAGQVSTHAILDGSEHAEGEPALAADGTLYVVMKTNDSASYGTYALYAVTPGGQVRWTHVVDYPSGGVTMGTDGTVYVPTSSGLIAIQGNSPLAASGWADEHGGLANLRSAAPPPATVLDAGVDAGVDAAVDAGVDAGADAGVDAGPVPDSGVDGGAVCSPTCTGDETCTDGACLDPNGCPSHSTLVGSYCECDLGYHVNAAQTACEPDAAGGSSCVGHCGGTSADQTCYCDSTCTTNGDCCTDYQATCG